MPIRSDKLATKVEVPEGVSVGLQRGVLKVEGPLGYTFKSFRKIPVNLKLEDGAVLLSAQDNRKEDYAILNTSRSLVRNLIEGIIEGYTIKMKIVFAHFPVSVKVDSGYILVENFQGEHAPRRAKIVGSTKVIPKEDDVIITGAVLTEVTQTAANVHQATRIKRKDHRVFLDGIYVYDKKKGITKS